MTEACYATTCLATLSVLEVLSEVRGTYAKSEHSHKSDSLEYNFAREEAFRWAFGLEATAQDESWALIRFNPI